MMSIHQQIALSRAKALREAIDTALHQDIFLHQETQFDIDMEIAKKRVLEVIKKEVKTQVDDTVKSMESTKMSQIVAEKPRVSQGQQHFVALPLL